MKRLLIAFLLLLPVTVHAAYLVDLKLTYGSSVGETLDSTILESVTFHGTDVITRSLVNNGSAFAFDTTLAVDSIGVHEARVWYYNSLGDSIPENLQLSSFYGVQDVNVSSVNSGALEDVDFETDPSTFALEASLFNPNADSVGLGAGTYNALAKSSEIAALNDPSAADVYNEFISGSNEDQFKADVSALATSAEIAALNDISAVDVWNVAFATGFAAGSIGDSLSTATYVQGTASGLTAADIYAYFISGNNEDAFKGGAGSGPDTVNLYVLSATDSTAIVGASCSYFVGADKLVTRTDANGLATFGATAGTYTMAVESKPRYAATQSIIAPSTDTIFLSDPALSAPSVAGLCKIQGYLADFGLDRFNATINLRAVTSPVVFNNTIVSTYEKSATLDTSTGYWYVYALPTDSISSVYVLNVSRVVTGTGVFGTRLQSIIENDTITVPADTVLNYTN